MMALVKQPTRRRRKLSPKVAAALVRGQEKNVSRHQVAEMAVWSALRLAEVQHHEEPDDPLLYGVTVVLEALDQIVKTKDVLTLRGGAKWAARCLKTKRGRVAVLRTEAVNELVDRVIRATDSLGREEEFARTYREGHPMEAFLWAKAEMNQEERRSHIAERLAVELGQGISGSRYFRELQVTPAELRTRIEHQMRQLDVEFNAMNAPTLITWALKASGMDHDSANQCVGFLRAEGGKTLKKLVGKFRTEHSEAAVFKVRRKIGSLEMTAEVASERTAISSPNEPVPAAGQKVRVRPTLQHVASQTEPSSNRRRKRRAAGTGPRTR
ncbi:MAG TPA: hypothetical protein VJT73_21115 [Polyangiaceae bacterium]|nr:hypothetical protein [Polyangiaceae bacterium]